MLLVFLPEALVAGPLYICVDSLAIRFIIQPLAIVNVPISMQEFALATCLIELPISLISCRVWPNHRSTTVAKTAFPLALVDCACLIRVDPVRQADVILILADEGFFGFFTLKIL